MSKALKDCCSFQEGYVNPSQSNSEYFDGDIKWLRTVDLNDRYVYDTSRKLTEKGYKSAGKSAFMFPKDSIAISKSGTIGTLGILKDVMCGNRAVINIDVNKEKVPLMYIFYLLKYKKAEIIKKSVGSIQKNLYVSALETIELCHNDKFKQEKIATCLSNIDNKIELNNKIIQELEALVKTIYDYWFLQFDFPNKEGKPYKSSGGKMTWNEDLKKHIPEGWKFETLDSNIDTIIDHRGKTPKKMGGDWVEDGIIALSAKVVKNGRLINLDQANKVSREMYEKWMPVKLQDGDILMTSEAPLGEFYYVLVKIEYCLSQRLYAIRANKSKVLSCYLYYELSKGNGYSQIIGSQSGSTVFGIRQDELRKIKILVPNMNIQKKFENIVNPMLANIKKLDIQTQELIQLRDWLLPMLMNGQVTFKTVNDIKEKYFNTERVAETSSEYKE